ncbi:MAG TPA: MlaD family protein [Candidatus Krumholzibacteria bacterium]|nr:MlaD family protein [Candidatus Krumholzibacteria bacterium]
MDRRTNELQVGLVTIISLAILVVGMIWLKDASVGRGTTMYYVEFPTVEGLQVGDRIQVRGIRAGQVDGFAVMDGFVRVGLRLDETIELRDDADIMLGTKGIVGEVVIEILPGTGDPVHEDHVFQGRTAASITQMTDAAGAALQEMRELTQQLNGLVTEVREQGKLIDTMAQANATLKRVDAMLAENSGTLRGALTDLAASAETLRALLASGKVEATLDGAAAAAARADSLMAGMAVTARRLDSILAKIDEGDGTAALLLNDPALYMRADSTMTSLQRLMDEMRRNPKKFVNLSVF